jgi:phytoene/squalene synthetase
LSREKYGKFQEFVQKRADPAENLDETAVLWYPFLNKSAQSGILAAEKGAKTDEMSVLQF